MRTYLSFCLLLLSYTANAATIDFENIATGTRPVFSVDGYTFSGSGVISGSDNDHDLFMNYTSGSTRTLTMSRDDGNAFAFHGLDESFSCNDTLYGDCYFTITGIVAGGGYVTGSGYGAGTEWGTGDWLNLQSLRFEMTGYTDVGLQRSEWTVDNLQVTAVPVPAAAWLFGSALAGLGWMRRKQTA